MITSRLHHWMIFYRKVSLYFCQMVQCCPSSCPVLHYTIDDNPLSRWNCKIILVTMSQQDNFGRIQMQHKVWLGYCKSATLFWVIDTSCEFCTLSQFESFSVNIWDLMDILAEWEDYFPLSLKNSMSDWMQLKFIPCVQCLLGHLSCCELVLYRSWPMQ